MYRTYGRLGKRAWKRKTILEVNVNQSISYCPIWMLKARNPLKGNSLWSYPDLSLQIHSTFIEAMSSKMVKKTIMEKLDERSRLFSNFSK